MENKFKVGSVCKHRQEQQFTIKSVSDNSICLLKTDYVEPLSSSIQRFSPSKSDTDTSYFNTQYLMDNLVSIISGGYQKWI